MKSSSDLPASRSTGKSGRGCWMALLAVIGIPLLLVIVAVLLFIGRERSGARKLQERIQQRITAGLPVDDQSLGQYHERLTSDAWGEEWQAVLRTIESEPFGQSVSGVPGLGGDAIDIAEIPDPGVAWAEEQVSVDFIEKWSELRDELRRLASQQHEPNEMPVRFDIQFKSMDTTLEHLNHLRNAARLLRLDGALGIREGNSKRVREDVSGLLGLANTLRGEPFLVAQLVMIAIDSIAMDLLRGALEHDVLDTEDLESLLPLVMARTTIGAEWHLALQGEIATALPVFTNPAARGAGTPPIPARSHDALMFLDHMESLIAVPTEDITKLFEASRQLEYDLEDELDSGLLARFDSIFTSMLAPSVSAAANAFVRRAALHRLGAIAIAIRLHEKQTGRFPQTLDELKEFGVEPDQLSPPAAKRFGYATDEIGAIVWGYDFFRGKELPTTPPTRPIGEDSYEVQQHDMWNWYLPTKATPE